MTRSALAILPGVGMPEHRFRIGQPRGWSLGRGGALLARHERGGARQVVAFDPAFMRAVATPPASWHSARRRRTRSTEPHTRTICDGLHVA